MRRVSGPGAESLSDDDLATIKRCLTVVVDGPHFQEWEFKTLFGLTRSELGDVLGAWPKLPAQTPPEYDSPEQYQHVAVGNALNNLLGYPVGASDDTFARAVGVPRERVVEVYKRWRSGVSASRPVQVEENTAPPRLSALAVASFLCGVTAVLLLVSGVIALKAGNTGLVSDRRFQLPFVLMFPAIGLGIGGLVKTRQRPHLKGRGLAIIGLAIGGLFLTVALLILWWLSQVEVEF
jgi:drug/metabolite transporter superfamily protein YnfA